MLEEQYEAIKNRIFEIDNKNEERNAKRKNIEAFIRILEKSDTLLNEFDEELWNGAIDTVTVHLENEITFAFKDGMELDWNMIQSKNP